ncbi:hypothetical protein ACIQVC_16625 [Streptomyces sp. NPDC101112]|uniref:hypothetical protein n=1 Tax=Streptomyces sp. NPDC101112 TaxID=3366105 RepID=UPI00382F3165
MDDDGYADVVESDEAPDSHGESFDKRVVWGGPDGSKSVTKLHTDGDSATGIGDFDGDGALDLLTVAKPSFTQSADGPQPATVLYGPLSRDDGVPRTTLTLDVGYEGWASVKYTAVGDFDVDGNQDILASKQVIVGEAGGDRAVAVYGSSHGPGRGEDRPGDIGNLKLGLRNVTVCDINGDSYDDIAIQSSNDGPVSQALGGQDGLSTIDR